MVTNETMLEKLEKCRIDKESKIIVYLEGDGNDGDYIGTLKTGPFTPEKLEYYRVMYHIINCGVFNREHWEERNPFEEYGIRDYYDYDYDDEDDSDDDEAVKKDYDEEREMMRIQLQLAYDFISENIPRTPGWCEMCHSVESFRVFIISDVISGELLDSPVTDEDIRTIYKRIHGK